MVTSVPVTVPIRALSLSPGSHLLIENVSWEQYEALLEELGENRLVPRINFCHNTLELMSPLPAHERPHRIMADIVKTLLDLQNRDWEDFGSSTFRKLKEAGLEPDTCFYIAHAEQMRKCERFDPDRDPPPDLAIESDITSATTLETYQTLQVPEVWIYTPNELIIHVLGPSGYRTTAQSPTFPSLTITKLVPQLIQEAKRIGTRQMLRQLRNQDQTQ
ncbi:MAG: Uma2 family endonuclease [Cyanobacteria bacterium J06623_4]